MPAAQSTADDDGRNITHPTMTPTSASSISGLFIRLINLASSRLALSVGAQGLVSGFHFLLNLVLLRLVTPYDYGIFAFAFVLAMFAQAVNNALISTPLTVYTPIIKEEGQRAQQEHMFSTLNILLFALLVTAGLFYASWSAERFSVTLSVALFVAVYSARHFSRSSGYARLQPLVTASGDATYVIVGLITISLLVLSGQSLGINHVLLALVAANLAAMLVERYRLQGKRRLGFSLQGIGDYRQIWAQSRWALVGSLTTLFLAQAHSLMITATHGPGAFAPLAAGFVLFGPVRVALLTWQNMVKPEMAVALSESRHQAIQQQVRRTSMWMIALVLMMGLVLWLFWPWIHALLYAEQYADAPMGWIVAVWSIITLFAAGYNAPSAALQALRDFRLLAMASIYGALISGVLVSLTLYLFHPETTLLGILSAEVFMAVYLARVLHLRLQKPR